MRLDAFAFIRGHHLPGLKVSARTFSASRVMFKRPPLRYGIQDVPGSSLPQHIEMAMAMTRSSRCPGTPPASASRWGTAWGRL